MVSGKVISKEKQEVVDFATVYLKGTTYGCTTNEEGIVLSSFLHSTQTRCSI